MKGRSFWMVFTVVLTLALFSTLAFGQVSKDDQVSNSVLQNIDSVTTQAACLQEMILAQLNLFDGITIYQDASGTYTVRQNSTTSDSTLCAGQLALYTDALNHLSTAWGYIDAAYEYYYRYVSTQNYRFLLKIGKSLECALSEISIACECYFQATAYTC